MLNTGQISRVFEKRYPDILFISGEHILTKKPGIILLHVLKVISILIYFYT